MPTQVYQVSQTIIQPEQSLPNCSFCEICKIYPVTLFVATFPSGETKRDD
ncbi:hypothetical protein [Floridanema evergladense]|uniref:Uncharacterized protein n=1 Tax=Floridaenema evergladense BLCC-F167 TaxID=3153639 RepID=A0ABV4WXY6_9CYAN